MTIATITPIGISHNWPELYYHINLLLSKQSEIIGVVNGLSEGSTFSAADKTVFSNISGVTAPATFNTLTAVLDHDLGNTNGMVATRVGGTWTASFTTLITGVGTITTGTWNGTAVGVQWGGTGANLSATGGANNIVQQASSGAAFTVGTVAYTGITQASGTLFAQTQAVTVANTVTESNLTGTGVGNLTLPANFFAAGGTLKFTAFGIHSATGNPTIRVRLYAGATVLLDTTAVTSGNSTNAIWDLRALITCYTTGNTGTVWAQGFYNETAGGTNVFGMPNTAAITLDTTTTQAIKLTVQWGTAAAGNTITMSNFTMEALKAA